MTTTADPDNDHYDDDTYRAVLGRRIRILRVAGGLSQQDLADQAHVTRNYISAIERNTQGLDLVRLRRLAHALGVPLADLINDNPNPLYLVPAVP